MSGRPGDGPGTTGHRIQLIVEARIAALTLLLEHLVIFFTNRDSWLFTTSASFQVFCRLSVEPGVRLFLPQRITGSNEKTSYREYQEDSQFLPVWGYQGYLLGVLEEPAEQRKQKSGSGCLE